MEHEQIPGQGTYPPSLAQFDAYIARAHAERARAVAEFLGQVAASLYRLASRLLHQPQPNRERGRNGTTAAR